MADTRASSQLRRWVLAVVLSGVVLAFAMPVLVDVYGQLADVAGLPLGWSAGVAGAQLVQLVSTWFMLRILLRTDAWFDVAASQLAGDAASNLTPGAALAGVGLQTTMLTRAGFHPARIGAAFAALTLLTLVPGALVLPIVAALGSLVTDSVDGRLIAPMWIAAGGLGGVLVVGALASRSERVWRAIAAMVTAVARLVRRPVDGAALHQRLVRERDIVKGAIRDRAGALGAVSLLRTAADCAALYLAVRATGSTIGVSAAVAVFVVGDVAGRIPLTPAGLGFVEVGLTGGLSLAGVPEGSALTAVVLYRLAATWIPSVAGAGAFALFRRRRRGEEVVEDVNLTRAAT